MVFRTTRVGRGESSESTQTAYHGRNGLAFLGIRFNTRTTCPVIEPPCVGCGVGNGQSILPMGEWDKGIRSTKSTATFCHSLPTHSLFHLCASALGHLTDLTGAQLSPNVHCHPQPITTAYICSKLLKLKQIETVIKIVIPITCIS